jgi:hypothetical protein
MTGVTKSGTQRALLYGLGTSGLQGPGSAPYSTLLYSTPEGRRLYKKPKHREEDLKANLVDTKFINMSSWYDRNSLGGNSLCAVSA